MSLTKGARVKGYIKNIETGETKKFQFNPNSFTYTQGATFNQTSSPSSPYPLISYAYGNASVIPLTLNMYGANTLNEIEDYIRFIEEFLPRKSTSAFKERTAKPKVMLFCYGTFIKTGLLQDFTYQHVRYNNQGVPIETILTLNVLELSDISDDPFTRPQEVNMPDPVNDTTVTDNGDGEVIVMYDPIVVNYSSHVENVGWQDYVTDGATSGTTGEGLRLEAVKINIVVPSDLDVSVLYQAHIQDVGWDTICSADEICGTVGEAERLEALKIYLGGTDSYKFDIYYRIHVENLGWMSWAKNGNAVGTAGYALRGEAIQIVVVSRI